MVLLNKIKNKLRINYRKKRWPGLIEAYKQYLPVTKKTPIISLNEGNTPLILSESISNLIGNGTKVFLKYDGLNPTGSFKDRGMTMAISKAKEEGREAVICASTGNTSAAAAAYASRGGLKPYVLIPEGFVAQGKLAQALMYGAEIISINGNFDKALEIVRDLSSEHPIELVNSVNPYRIQGQKTAAFEIVDDLGYAPDWLCIPMGNAGNITAYWMGFKEYSKIKRNLKLPIMMGFQSEGSAPLVKNIIVKDPETIATAIRIGNPVNREKAKKVRKESKGDFQSVTDEEIVRDLSSEHPIELVNSVNPYRIQGQKTAAFEIVDDLGYAPDWLCIPMGNAGNITAYWMGFKEYSKIKRNLKLPIMMGFQSEGSAPLVKNIIVKDPETIATAIRIGNPVNREKAKKVRKESKGDFQSVTDEEIINAYKILAKEGVFCEPASAASVAGLIKNKNRIQKESTIVCVLTGNGLKDPDCAIKNNDAIFRKNIEPSLKNITKILGY